MTDKARNIFALVLCGVTVASITSTVTLSVFLNRSLEQTERVIDVSNYWRRQTDQWREHAAALGKEAAGLLRAARDSGAFPDEPCTGSIDYQKSSPDGIAVCVSQDAPCSGPSPCTVCRAAPLGVCMEGRWYVVRP